MGKEARATLAQTRILMQMWLEQRPMPHVIGKGIPTMDVLAKRGWIIETAMTYTYPNGSMAQMYVLSPTGLRAAQIGFAQATLKGYDA